jgi:hypothetical protein
MSITGSRGRRVVVAVAATLALVGGGVAAGAATASRGSPPLAARTVAQTLPRQAARARASLLRYLKQDHPLANVVNQGGLQPGGTSISAHPAAPAQGATYNWGGYLDSGSPGTFTAVSASWFQPATFCSQEQRVTAFWVGLDGWNSTTVEQDGTIAYCFEGVPYYYSWWEMFPAGVVFIGTSVRAGDLIKASVTVSGGSNYTLALTDVNHPADSFTTVQSCQPSVCQDSSADWLIERPEFSIGVCPLSTFSDWNLMNASQTSDGVTGSIGSGPGVTQISMLDATSTYPLLTTTGLNRAENGFGARWLNSY